MLMIASQPETADSLAQVIMTGTTLVAVMIVAAIYTIEKTNCKKYGRRRLREFFFTKGVYFFLLAAIGVRYAKF